MCGRSFSEDAIEKHRKICEKVSQSKRKCFDSKKKRIIDPEHASMLRKSEIEKKQKNTRSDIKNGKPKWKRQSDELRSVLKMNNTCTSGFNLDKNSLKDNFNSTNNINNNKGLKRPLNLNAQKFGSFGSSINNYQQTESVYAEDYIHCNMCNRKYNEQAHKKHLATCERRSKEANLKSKNSNSNINNLNVNFNSTNNQSLNVKPGFNLKFKK